MPIEFNDENKFSEYLHDLLRLTSTQQRALGQGYQKIIGSVNALYCHMENLSAKDANGKNLPISQEQHEQTIQLYETLQKDINSFRLNNDLIDVPTVSNALSGFSNIITNDLTLFKQMYISGKETLPEILERGRNVEVRLSQDFNSIQGEGGAISNRRPLTFTDSNNNVREGFFTIDEKLDSNRNIPAHDNLSYLGGKDGSSIAQRNVAMSRIAKLLGASDLLAESVKMKIIENGKVREGIFMDTAKGEDLTRMSLDRAKQLNNVQYTDDVLRQISDVQMLDTICMNIDRHCGNLLYQFDDSNGTPVLKGIVGIDNDYSFGTNTPRRANEKLNGEVGVNVINICSKTMASKIGALNKQMFDIALEDIDLDPEEKLATWERIQTIKQRIKNKEIAVCDNGDFEKNKEQLVNDEGSLFHQVDVRGFKYTYKATERTPERFTTQKKDSINYVKTEYVKYGVFAEREVVNKTLKQFATFQETLNKARGFFTKDSPMYSQMMESLNKTQEDLNKFLRGEIKTDDYKKSINDFKADVATYLEYKQTNLNGKVAMARFNTAKDIKQFLDNSELQNAGQSLEATQNSQQPGFEM